MQFWILHSFLRILYKSLERHTYIRTNVVYLISATEDDILDQEGWIERILVLKTRQSCSKYLLFEQFYNSAVLWIIKFLPQENPSLLDHYLEWTILKRLPMKLFLPHNEFPLWQETEMLKVNIVEMKMPDFCQKTQPNPSSSYRHH